MKRVIYRLSVLILALCMIAGVVTSASAAPATDSYNYWTDVSAIGDKAVYNKAMYDVENVFDVSSVGVDTLTKITNICSDDDDNIYILDSKSRVIVLDNKYNLVREIGLIGGVEAYDEARGIYVYEDNIYICDTEGARIIQSTLTGDLVDIITLPKSLLIPDDFTFKPTRIVRDAHNYLYVLSEGSYYGALIYDPQKNFLGFYGSNKYNISIGTVISNIYNRLFPNPEKHENSTKKHPYTFVDLTIDDEGFIYTCNGYTSYEGLKGQIRKLSPGSGTNILDSDVNFVDQELLWELDFSKQDLSDIEVDNDGFIYALETKFGKIFMYDDDCRTLTVFGGGMGEGIQKGTFVNPSGMEILNNGETIIVCDGSTNLITTFVMNDFGKKVKELDRLTLTGNYDKVKEGWFEIISEDSNCQVAYSGIANAYLEEEDYDNALKYAKLGYDRDTYAVAFEYVRKDFISDNFTWIFIIIVVVVIGAIALMFVTNKHKITFIKNKTLSHLLATAVHPSDNFALVKEKGMGSIPVCIVLIILYYVVTVLRSIAGGFLFTKYDPASFNSIIVLLRSAGLVVLWIMSNWLVCTLLGGKGKLKEITIVTCYSLLPIIVEGVIYIILSNVMLPSESSILGIIGVIATLYFGLLLIIGMLKIHDFSMGRFIGTTLLSIFAMAVIVFLLILLIILVQQLFLFIVTLITEISTI